MRLPIALLARTARFDAARYVLALFAAAVVYCSVRIVVGVALGDAIEAALQLLHLRLLLPLIVLLAIGLFVVPRLRRRRRSAAHGVVSSEVRARG